MDCLNCGTEIKQTPKKKEKIFCNSTCRSNYWQKSKRLEEQGFDAEEIIKKIKETWKPKEKKAEPQKEQPQKQAKKSPINDFWKERMKKKLGI